MTTASWAFLCLAYIIGLLASGFEARLPIAAIALSLVALSGLLAVIIPHRWRRGPSWSLWLAGGILAAIAVVYCQLRQPQPADSDVSRYVGRDVVVAGRIVEPPSRNREQRVRLILAAQQLNQGAPVTGKLYVTLPLLHGTGLVPGQVIQVRGRLYEPQAAASPGSFDFRAYLARQGIFAGLSGRLAAEPAEQPSGLWQLRQRVARAQTRWLGSPVGPLLSSIALGRRAVDLPVEIRDRFTQAGLAHTLAASGFHVSLLLGVVIALTANLGSRAQISIGLVTLIFYAALTGGQPSVLRAAIMGSGALLGLATARQRNPLGLWLVAATGLLLYNPLWIWNLGFQLSFLATLGLLVTVPPLSQRLDWLPPTLATAIAVPLAAALWTLPLLAYTFNTVALYGVLLNVAATPLIALVSLGGILSAAIALLVPIAGSALAWSLGYPTRSLLWLAEWVNDLPGSTLTLGRLALWQLVLAYAVMVGIWVWPLLRRWGWWIGLLALAAIALPLLYQQQTRVQMVVLDSPDQPVVVVQEQGRTTLIGAGTPDTARYTIAPFLRQAGIRRLDWAIALDEPPDRPSGWSELAAQLSANQLLHAPLAPEQTPPTLPATQVQALAANQQVQLGALTVSVLSLEPTILQLQFHDQVWLLLGNPPVRVVPPPLPPTTLLWSGEALPAEWLQTVKPTVAIATGNAIAPTVQAQLQQHQVQTYLTGQAALQWRPGRGFRTTDERRAE
ncbi:MAG: DUF4131 domain-containing protein [Spirulinaceae cyanobacterium SM2_1_0]|nr:DUF4131 domain-containing protein [Spirulinaceae cyanobacterium SM2_1_0]